MFSTASFILFFYFLFFILLYRHANMIYEFILTSVHGNVQNTQTKNRGPPEWCIFWRKFSNFPPKNEENHPRPRQQ